MYNDSAIDQIYKSSTKSYNISTPILNQSVISDAKLLTGILIFTTNITNGAIEFDFNIIVEYFTP